MKGCEEDKEKKTVQRTRGRRGQRRHSVEDEEGNRNRTKRRWKGRRGQGRR